MRLAFGIAAVLLAGSAPASAAPNVFWTFGFDLPQHGERAPHFGAAATERSYAGNVRQPADAMSISAFETPSAAPVVLATASAVLAVNYIPSPQAARLSPGQSGAAAQY